jgi:rod shape-determining protein MreD
MIIVIPIIIISMLLESIISNFIALDSSIFIPLFSIISLVIIYPYFNNNDFNYLKYCTIIGLCYDIIFTNTLILNMVMFFVIGVVIKLINVFISNNPLNITLISVASIIVYRFFTYIVLVTIGYFKYDFDYLLKSIYSSIFINVIYAIIVYLIADYYSKKYRISKID